MTTKDIITKIKEFSGEIRSFECLLEKEVLDEETYNKLKLEDWETTNPRRDYVGTRHYILNKEDNLYFAMEIYGDDSAMELYSCVPVERVVQVKEVVKFIETK